MKWLDGITDLMDMSLSKLREWTGKPGMLQSMGLQKLDMTERLDWTEVLKPGLRSQLEDCGFWLGLCPNQVCSSPRVGFGWVRVPL